MSSEANKALVRRIVAEIWNRANLDAADELYAPDYTRNGEVLGPAGVRHMFAVLTAAMPDLHYTIDDIVAEGDKVVFRGRSHGSHTGEWAHPTLGRLAPTGREITMRGIGFYRVADGRATEVWTFGDAALFLQQIGATVVPPAQMAGVAG